MRDFDHHFMYVLQTDGPAMLHLVRITPKRNLHVDVLDDSLLPMFQFFLADILSKRTLRLIPKIE